MPTVLSFFFVFPCFLSPCDDELRTVLASPSNSGSGFCVGFFYAGTSAEMKAIAGTILCVYWIPFLSFSLCIISLLRVFCFCFGSSFSGLIALFFWVFSASGVLTFSALVPPMIFGSIPPKSFSPSLFASALPFIEPESMQKPVPLLINP
ncbi:hypothetical protein Peur_029812 [Populus x canadensis]